MFDDAQEIEENFQACHKLPKQILDENADVEKDDEVYVEEQVVVPILFVDLLIFDDIMMIFLSYQIYLLHQKVIHFRNLMTVFTLYATITIWYRKKVVSLLEMNHCPYAFLHLIF